VLDATLWSQILTLLPTVIGKSSTGQENGDSRQEFAKTVLECALICWRVQWIPLVINLLRDSFVLYRICGNIQDLCPLLSEENQWKAETIGSYVKVLQKWTRGVLKLIARYERMEQQKQHNKRDLKSQFEQIQFKFHSKLPLYNKTVNLFGKCSK